MLNLLFNPDKLQSKMRIHDHIAQTMSNIINIP